MFSEDDFVKVEELLRNLNQKVFIDSLPNHCGDNKNGLDGASYSLRCVKPLNITSIELHVSNVDVNIHLNAVLQLPQLTKL